MRISDCSSDVCSSDLVAMLIKHPRADMAANAAKPASEAAMERAEAEAGELIGLPALERRRSEEHTSELQSLMRISYAVFCLKKKKQTTNKSNLYPINNV